MTILFKTKKYLALIILKIISMTYVKKLMFEWNVCRLVRIAGGVPIVIMGVREQHWPSVVFGAAFVALGMFTTQCCSAGGCSTPSIKTKRPGREEMVEFEEIKK